MSGQDDGDEVEVVTMVDETGKERDFAFLTLVELDGQQFAVLAPKEQVEGDDPDLELYAFKYTETEDGADLDAVEDQELLDRVYLEAESILFDADEFDDSYEDETPDDEDEDEEEEEA